jgi:two-component system nitrogen regulation sensor histidine kinase NtrY
MVDEFSSFARMPKARLERDDLRACVNQVVFLMRVGHPEVTIDEDLPDEPFYALFDRRLLSQALTNIVKNATEGITGDEDVEKPAPRVQVRLSRTDDGQIAIDVIDNGKGFPKENRQRLLEPYMTTRAEGTGLGLPIVAKILEDHGGGIDLLDAPDGKGAWVRLHFAESSDVVANMDNTLAINSAAVK